MSTYELLKVTHMTTAAISISLFVLRVLLSLRQPYSALPKALRIVPHVNDTALLASAIGLAVVLQQYPLTHHWLSAKIVALLAYIGCGMITLRRAKSVPAKLLWAAISISLFAYIVLVARSHQVLPF